MSKLTEAFFVDVSIFTSLTTQIVDCFVACMYKKVHLSDMKSIHIKFHVDSTYL